MNQANNVKFTQTFLLDIMLNKTPTCEKSAKTATKMTKINQSL